MTLVPQGAFWVLNAEKLGCDTKCSLLLPGFITYKQEVSRYWIVQASHLSTDNHKWLRCLCWLTLPTTQCSSDWWTDLFSHSLCGNSITIYVLPFPPLLSSPLYLHGGVKLLLSDQLPGKYQNAAMNPFVHTSWYCLCCQATQRNCQTAVKMCVATVNLLAAN